MIVSFDVTIISFLVNPAWIRFRCRKCAVYRVSAL